MITPALPETSADVVASTTKADPEATCTRDDVTMEMAAEFIDTTLAAMISTSLECDFSVRSLLIP